MTARSWMLRMALLIAAGGALAAACGNAPPPYQQQLERVDARKQEITVLWAQIRDWRQEARWPVDPPNRLIRAAMLMSVDKARAVCPFAQPSTVECTDVCSLAEAICANADSICSIARELGGDPWADDKCNEAKASCREAKKRCCDCVRQEPEPESEPEPVDAATVPDSASDAASGAASEAAGDSP